MRRLRASHARSHATLDVTGASRPLHATADLEHARQRGLAAVAVWTRRLAAPPHRMSHHDLGRAWEAAQPSGKHTVVKSLHALAPAPAPTPLFPVSRGADQQPSLLLMRRRMAPRSVRHHCRCDPMITAPTRPSCADRSALSRSLFAQSSLSSTIRTPLAVVLAVQKKAAASPSSVPPFLCMVCALCAPSSQAVCHHSPSSIIQQRSAGRRGALETEVIEVGCGLCRTTVDLR